MFFKQSGGGGLQPKTAQNLKFAVAFSFLSVFLVFSRFFSVFCGAYDRFLGFFGLNFDINSR